MKKGIFYLISCFVWLTASYGQMPVTNIYLINYIKDGNLIKEKEIRKISKGIGYNNQPSFSSDCKQVYFTSNISDSSQTDLYSYDVEEQTYHKLSNSILSEYSPMVRPGTTSDVSHVVVEEDKKQHLRLYNEEYSYSTNLIPCSDSIGYYIWTDSLRLGLIILNNGLEFHTYYLGNSSTKLISKNSGRFINYDKKTKCFIYLEKSDSSNSIKYYNTSSGLVVKAIPALMDCEDYAIDNQSVIYGSFNGKLFSYQNDQWQPVADFSKQIGFFYRLTYCTCGKHLCVVSYAGNKP